MQLQDMLYSQGFGVRRVCSGLVQQGWVQLWDVERAKWVQVDDSTLNIDPEGLRFKVQGVEWEYHALGYVLLNKPAGTECSQKPSMHPSIYSLLPLPLRNRPNKNAIQGVQAVGRLDQDTTGMLLLSDDGQFIHRMSSPKKHVPKLYQVTAKHAVTQAQVDKLLAGVVLDDDPKPVKAAGCVKTGDNTLDLTLTEGKYHQVKRMLAAVSNRVEGLHRAQIGGLRLDNNLKPGEWRWVTPEELVLLKP
ncbi:MAG: 16S rRNA pseudouridine(516) synthase [Comamonas sp.]